MRKRTNVGSRNSLAVSPRHLVAAAVLALVIGCDPPPVEGRRVGNICPEISGADVDGNPIRLSDFKGKVVLVDFWGTWCGPCREQIPHEKQKVLREYKDRPFVLLGVAQDTKDHLKEFLATSPLPWPNILDETNAISDRWGVAAFPSFILVDHKGLIRKKWLDGGDPDAVWAAVARAMKEAEGG